MTKGQIAYAISEHRCLNDGGPIIELVFKLRNSEKISRQRFSPHSGYATARDIKFNGGEVLEINKINH